eukprot:6013868-Alexandrium_andersonii.AAC.1
MSCLRQWQADRGPPGPVLARDAGNEHDQLGVADDVGVVGLAPSLATVAPVAGVLGEGFAHAEQGLGSLCLVVEPHGPGGAERGDWRGVVEYAVEEVLDRP